MYQKFLQYFKNNNIKIFLKYDGEREKNFYTVIIFNKEKNNKLFKNTDKPYETFVNFISELNIHVSNEVNKQLYKSFEELKKKLTQKVNNDVVFVYTVELKEDVEYYISIESNEITTNYKDTELDNIFNFVKNLDF
ncbi:hypothetical protein [Chengkuizengella sediminis]|uniref:hypothetical protein n=1 Tax=Chengkuizengella sediminis TaxID=1885917 RepID=UPI00138A444B|nr:hypothetical protein [Chengkuizengella sediminis]NDI34765.1 hypothetical protein [Chengkuizengella sediminis]